MDKYKHRDVNFIDKFYNKKSTKKVALAANSREMLDPPCGISMVFHQSEYLVCTADRQHIITAELTASVHTKVKGIRLNMLLI